MAHFHERRLRPEGQALLMEVGAGLELPRPQAQVVCSLFPQ